MNLKQENKLIDQCIKGRQKAQYELYELYAPTMFSLCKRYAKDYDQAAEMLQTGFIKAFQKLEQFNQSGPFGAWLRRLMVNNCFNHIKANKRFETHNDIYDKDIRLEIETEIEIDQLLDEQTILNLINELREEYKLVFSLYCLEQYSHSEIAEILSIKETTSRSWLRRARAELKEKVEKAITNQ